MNTIKFLNNNTDANLPIKSVMNKLRTAFYAIGICWTDELQGEFINNNPYRVILYTRSTNVEFKNPMCKECNGLVVEYFSGKWKLLAMPMHSICTNKISMKKVNMLYSANAYDTYEVLDATILTLYYYNGRWRLSSKKSYDIGDIEMVNGITFMDAIHDLMESKYKSFKFNNLNCQFSYTIGLRYSRYHIFDETKHMDNRTTNIPPEGVDMNSYIMVLAVADLQTAHYVSKYVAGLPRQNPMTRKDLNINVLLNYARSAYAKYAKAYRLQNFKYKPLYGYVLRAKHKNVPNEYSTIYIESELYKIIKTGLYKDNSAIRNANYNQLIVQMSNNYDRYEQFKILFQQFDDKFNKLNNLVDQLSLIVTERIICDGMEESKDDHMLSEQEEIFIGQMVAKFKNESNITSGVIRDAIFSKQFVNHLYELL